MSGGRTVVAVVVVGAAAALFAGRLEGSTGAASTVSPGCALGLTRHVVAAKGPSGASEKSIADVNGDRRPDLIVAAARGAAVWYRNPDWTRFAIGNGSSESGSAAADLDRDGDVDVVIGTTWYENDGRGQAWTPHSLGFGGTHDIVLDDFDDDGKLDVAMRGEYESRVDVFFQNGKTDWEHMALDPRFGLNGLDAGDLDGDRRPDLAVGGLWLRNPGGADARTAGSWQLREFADWNPWAAVRIADVSGDRRPDIVLSVSESGGAMAWFEAPSGPARGTWARHTIATGLNSVHSVDVVDIDRDGRPDVVASEFRGDGRLLAYLNQGRGRAWAVVTLARGEELHNTRVADINGDGRPDVFGVGTFGEQPVVLYESAGTLARRVLVFSRTLGFRHASIPHAVRKLCRLGAANRFTVDATEDPSAFTTANLAHYRAVVFLNPSGKVLAAGQRTAFQRFVRSGGGFVGIHNASSLVLQDWPWYTRLVGARARSEIETQPLRLLVVNRAHPSTRGLPSPWLITEEAYNFDVNPKKRGVTVLVNLDERFSKDGTMGRDHPFSWYRRYDGGRSWYTTGGANAADYDNQLFMRHVLGGITWAGKF